MSNKLTMTDLYNKLEKLGFSKEFIRAIGLPSWWVDELDLSTEPMDFPVRYEAANYVSQRLYVDLKSLIDITQEAKFVNNMTYKEVISVLKQRKECLLELRRLGVDISANDVNDYFEQLLEYDLEEF